MAYSDSVRYRWDVVDEMLDPEEVVEEEEEVVVVVGYPRDRAKDQPQVGVAGRAILIHW